MINVSAHTFISRYTPNKEYSHAPSKRRFLQFLSLKTIKGNLETGPCLFVRNEGSFNTEADGYKQVRPERQQQSELLIRSVHRAATTLEPARAATGAAGGGPQCFVGFVEL